MIAVSLTVTDGMASACNAKPAAKRREYIVGAIKSTDKKPILILGLDACSVVMLD